jgi:hypothetical protein
LRPLRHSDEDMEIVHRLFPRCSWPSEVAYPNLIALVGHISVDVAANKAVTMIDVASLFIERALCVGTMAVIYSSANRNPLGTNSGTWAEAVRDFEDEDFETVRGVFPRNAWPHERHQVPYPNLVALVRWNNEMRMTQSFLLAAIHNSMLGKREVLHEWQKIWEGREMCKDVGCSCDDYVSVFCTEMQGYVHEVMD